MTSKEKETHLLKVERHLRSLCASISCFFSSFREEQQHLQEIHLSGRIWPMALSKEVFCGNVSAFSVFHGARQRWPGAECVKFESFFLP